MTEEMLAKREKDVFDAGFAAGQDWTALAGDYARQLVELAVKNRIDENWLFRARDFLKKTTKPEMEKANVEGV